MRFFLLFITVFSFLGSNAQNGYVQKQKIAIFAPLYLDSAFDSMENYRFEKNEFPEYLNPGLEFYEGVQLALDSLAKEGRHLEVFIYDTRSSTATLNQLLEKKELDSVGLIIAHCTSGEVRYFAEAGLRKNIPVINVNVPNDGGARANPYFVMLNSTLKTQCEGIYRYMQKYFATNQLIVFRKKGQIEDMIKGIFENHGKNTSSVPLKIKYVDLIDSFSINQLRTHLDSNRNTLCIAGSLNEHFGKRLAQQLAVLKKQYPVTLMGMPTWDAIREFGRPEYKELEIIYSTPFYNAKTDKISQFLTNYFNTVMFARPSDMVFRGYEVTYKYGRLLNQYEKDLPSNLTNKNYNVFTDFDIQPVLSGADMTLDYFENKKLYFLKWQNGVIKSVN
jgi:hypothetical protein